MYKLLLCWRYLRTRYIALASIVSVMLGVATMIVVNSVMAGFSAEMQDRIKGVLLDVSVDSRNFNGMPDPEAHMARIREVAGEHIDWMVPVVHTPGMLIISRNGQSITKPIQLVGRPSKSHGGKFNQYLQHPKNRDPRTFSFQLRDGGYDVRDRHGGDEAAERIGMDKAGWWWRRELARRQKIHEERQRLFDSQQTPGAVKADEKGSTSQTRKRRPFALPDEPDVLHPAITDQRVVPASGEEQPQEKQDPFNQVRGTQPGEGHVFDPSKDQHTGCILGMALVSYRTPDGRQEHFQVLPGDDVQITIPTAGTPPKATSDFFTVVDFSESKMSQFDGSFVVVPIEKLQELRGMHEPETGVGFVSSIQIKLKDEADAELVRDKLQAVLPLSSYSVQTWRDKQGALLAAVQMETAILNVLLFLIIAVAGFGILAIFFTIVVEKTKDIGILKSLGAGSSGIMGIFLSYGLSLGIVGSGVGLVLGLLFVRYINEIADWLGRLTGREVFDPAIYYFYKIPTAVNVLTVSWIVVGALLIAVAASVLPACRAARFKPVEALRYE